VMEERLQILQMVKDGKVSAEEGLKLLEALEPRREAVNEPAPQYPGAPAKWLRVRVHDPKTGRSKVNVNVPIALLDIAGRFVKPEHMHGVDINAVIKAIKEGARGKIVDVSDEEEGVQVEVTIE